MLYFLLTVRPVITTVLTLLPSLLVLSFPLPYRSEFLLASNISYRSVVCSNNRQPGLTYFYRECRPLWASNNFRSLTSSILHEILKLHIFFKRVLCLQNMAYIHPLAFVYYIVMHFNKLTLEVSTHVHALVKVTSLVP